MTRTPTASAPSLPGPFLDGVVRHLQAFAAAAGTAAADVHVRLTLADGAVVVTQGLRTAGPLPSNSSGWGMIEGVGPTGAVVVREAHVLKAEFDLAPAERRPIGLHAEAGSP